VTAVADRTTIEWSDATWNPVTGCTKVSAGCDHCYAETFAERFRGTPGHYFERGFDVVLRPDKLELPLRWKHPRRIFVNSMSDLFHDDIPDSYIAQVFEVMARAPHHTFQVLTKRHARMRSLLSRPSFRDNLAHWGAGWPLPNVWLGVSTENQQWADIRIPALLDTPAAVRWISAEPLLGPIDISRWQQERPVGRDLALRPLTPSEMRACRIPGLDWLVVGGESGRGARPMHPDWPRRLRYQCEAAGIPFLFKQWGEWTPMAPLRDGKFDFTGAYSLANDGTLYEPGALAYPDGPRYGEAIRADHGRAHLTSMYLVGKKAAGRELDGELHDGYPA
jgi:protein gp37